MTATIEAVSGADSVTGSPAATVAIVAATTSAVALLALHVLSAEFAPSWRMVSEYALGRHGWALTLVFLAWGIASWSLTASVWRISATWFGRIGLLFLALAGVGQVMGGLFDVTHPLHGAAFGIGVPSMTIAAVIVPRALRRTGTQIALWPAHLVWISVVLMAVTLALFLGALDRAGVDVSAQTQALAELPEGVNGYNGWANRLVFAASYIWLITTAATRR